MSKDQRHFSKVQHKCMHVDRKINPVQRLINKAIGRISRGVDPVMVNGQPVIFWHIDENYLTDDMTRNEQVLMLTKAFEHYQPAISWVQFRATGDIDEAQITVRFLTNDSPELPFEFEPDTIAYVIEGDGDVWMNDDFDYTDGWKREGMNGVIVIAHEVGHSMSSGHSDLYNSLMAPYIDPEMGDITHDIIAESEYFYGEFKPVIVEPEIVEPAPSPETIDLAALIRAFIRWLRNKV